MTPSIRLVFKILDTNNEIIVKRDVTFPYDIDAWELDDEIAQIFLRIDKKKTK